VALFYFKRGEKMQSEIQYINIYFTKEDKEILAWANMIRENNLNLSTWIQAILVAENAGFELDIGTISIPVKAESATIQQSPKPSLFGDDTILEKKKQKTGWNIRGENGKLKEGSVLSIKVTRQEVQDAMFVTKRKHKRLGTYIKALIRKKLRSSSSKTNRLPDKANASDVFALYASKQKNVQSSTSKKNKTFSKQELTQQKSQPQTGPQQKHARYKEEQKAFPQEKKSEEKQHEEHKKKNPLLNYI